MNQNEYIYKQFTDGFNFQYPDSPSTAWDAYTKRWVVTNDGVTLTPSVVANGMGGTPPNLMQIASSGGVAHSLHREMFLRPDKNFTFSEIRSIAYLGDMTAGATQYGHVHGWQMVSATKSRAFVVWTDAQFGLTNWLNLAIWESDGTTLTQYGPGGGQLAISPAPVMPVTHCSRNGSNVVTCVVPGNHGIQVGGSVKTVLPASGGLDTTSSVVTAVSGANVSYTLAGAAVAAGGGGTIQKVGTSNLDNCPLVIASRLTDGQVLQAKLWRLGDQEVPWSAGWTVGPAAAAPGFMVPAPGYSGVMAGHLGNGQAIRFGLPIYTSL